MTLTSIPTEILEMILERIFDDEGYIAIDDWRVCRLRLRLVSRQFDRHIRRIAFGLQEIDRGLVASHERMSDAWVERLLIEKLQHDHGTDAPGSVPSFVRLLNRTIDRTSDLLRRNSIPYAQSRALYQAALCRAITFMLPKKRILQLLVPREKCHQCKTWVREKLPLYAKFLNHPPTQECETCEQLRAALMPYYGWSLHTAVYDRNLMAASLLLNDGAPTEPYVSPPSYHFSKHPEPSLFPSPLTLSVSRSADAITKLLIEHGVEVSIPDQHGWTPLHYAADRGETPLVELLLSERAYVNLYLQICRSKKAEKTYRINEAPLHRAALRGHLTVAKKLLENHGNPDLESADGHTPVYLAVCQGDVSMVRLLLGSTCCLLSGGYPTEELHEPAKHRDYNDYGEHDEGRLRATLHRALRVAMYRGDLDMIDLLLPHVVGPDPAPNFRLPGIHPVRDLHVFHRNRYQYAEDFHRRFELTWDGWPRRIDFDFEEENKG